MNQVNAKKHLGQHFLTDESIARRIASSLRRTDCRVLEIGPGMGVLTKYLLSDGLPDFHAVEIDRESVDYLHDEFPQLDFIEGDFLKLDLLPHPDSRLAIIGNFPYNISSQILFRVFDHRANVDEVVGMFQKEVAERVAAAPGSKTYGILSVLLGAFYDIEYLFTVSETVFNPPPKVKSAVIRLTRNSVEQLPCDEKMFVRTVKAGFNLRRKTLRNALRAAALPIDTVPDETLAKRAEQLSVEQFITLTQTIEQCQ